MRRLTGLAGAVVLLLAAVSCDTTQPADAGPQTFSVGVTSAASTPIYNIWEQWFDANGDGVITTTGTCSVSGTACTDTSECPAGETCDFVDVFLGFLCQQSGSVNTGVPWRFSAEISLVRNGTVEEEILATSVGTANVFSNLTPYTEGFFGVPGPGPNTPPIYYIRGRRDAGGGRYYLENCRGKVLAEPNVLGQTPQYELTLNQGDTVVIRVRKQLEASADPDLVPLSVPSLTISGFLEGRAVSLEGNPDTTGDGGGTTQSFTLQ